MKEFCLGTIEFLRRMLGQVVAQFIVIITTMFIWIIVFSGKTGLANGFPLVAQVTEIMDAMWATSGYRLIVVSGILIFLFFHAHKKLDWPHILGQIIVNLSIIIFIWMMVIRIEGHMTMSNIEAHGTINVVEVPGYGSKVIWWILVIAFVIGLVSKKWDWPFKWPWPLSKK